MRTKIIFTTLLVLIMIGLTCVSAAEDNQTVANEILEEETIDEELLSESTGTFTDLKNEINNAASGTLELDRDYAFDNTTDTEGCYLKDNFVLDGKGHTLDGKGKSNILWTYNENIVIKNIIFKNGFAEGTHNHGGALYIGSGPAHIINCTFINNNAGETLSGGGIYTQYGGTLIENCTFINNTATSGGGLSGSFNLINSKFINNLARSGGGAVDANGISSKISDCLFVNNTAYNVNGGAISADYAEIKNSVFINNTANNDGGAISSAGVASMKNLTFINNLARGEGGAVYVGSDHYQFGLGSITDSTFINNTAYISGGAAWINIIGDVKNNVFINNSARKNGGGIYLGAGTVSNSTFIQNKAGEDGGGVCIHNIQSDYSRLNASVAASTFTQNSAKTGGAIWINSGHISDVAFTENNATKSGGAVYVSVNSTIENSDFNGNKANGVDNDYVSENANTIIRVASDTEIRANDLSCAITSDKSYSIALRDVKGFSLAGETVTFAIDGEKIGSVVSDSYGIATITLTPDILKAAKSGTKDLTMSFAGSDDYNPTTKTVKITINKENAQITANSASYVINYGGKYSTTIKDSKGNALAGQKVTFTLNGKSIGSATTDAKGVATVTLTAKILKAVKSGSKNLVIKSTNDVYNIDKTVKVTVSKEASKITAKKKTFKKAVKTKKYAITLKNSKGKAIKKVKVSIKINGKTYTAKTNSKGKATFKITKLTKKGTFKAKITYKGNAYYKAVEKTVKIKIK